MSTLLQSISSRCDLEPLNLQNQTFYRGEEMCSGQVHYVIGQRLHVNLWCYLLIVSRRQAEVVVVHSEGIRRNKKEGEGPVL